MRPKLFWTQRGLLGVIVWGKIGVEALLECEVYTRESMDNILKDREVLKGLRTVRRRSESEQL